MIQKRNFIVFLVCPMLLANNVYAGLLSVPSKSKQNSSDNILLSLSSFLEKKEEISTKLISVSRLNEKEEDDSLLSEETPVINDNVKQKVNKIDEINIQKIIDDIETKESDIQIDIDFKNKEYSYREDMPEIYKRINNDAISVINRYMSKTKYIPIKDPLWFLAIGAVEYNYYNKENKDIICSWPIDISDYENTNKYSKLSMK